ncbi:methylated-DNA--[protein]-cysteine S-methyltransferase [Neisseria dumasiana]|uniref:Cysteine methyltransferase n=1 Tax=Neisseria dumasiana TaxID=1931275 RepID=A0ABX3WK04_9NEIS|nr:methylated-DNA--[protein]-cysteine S-methyltransferase [Neisseria dumasiana]OSI33500.1 cysteine methyltransferase [Neisseria dumasiana]UOO85078.1 methylated-DNA--[protein]-cysteine S-methyltransferase [Neisseria dumasiana]
MNYPCLYSAPFGDITLIFDAEENLVELNLYGRPEYAPYPLPEAWKKKLDDYFSGRLKNFHHPISTQGTAFQQKVWQAIAEIPAGEVLTYQDIARKIGSHPRTVGGACGKNPLALVVPCHRVVAKQGLGGFSSGEGDALAIKRWLLQHEGIEINSK